MCAAQRAGLTGTEGEGPPFNVAGLQLSPNRGCREGWASWRAVTGAELLSGDLTPGGPPEIFFLGTCPSPSLSLALTPLG